MKKLIGLFLLSILFSFVGNTEVNAQMWAGEYNIRMKVKNNFVNKEHYTMGKINVRYTNGKYWASITFADPYNGAKHGGNIVINPNSSVLSGSNVSDAHPDNHVQHTYKLYKESGKVKGYWQTFRLNPQTGNFDLQFNVTF